MSRRLSDYSYKVDSSIRTRAIRLHCASLIYTPMSLSPMACGGAMKLSCCEMNSRREHFERARRKSFVCVRPSGPEIFISDDTRSYRYNSILNMNNTLHEC